MLKRRMLGVFVFLMSLPLVLSESIADKLSFFGQVDFFNNLPTSNGFAKFLLFLLVALIVYSIGGFFPFTERKPFVNAAISVIVAILSTMFLTS
ncbi:MAG: hypothetical protein AABY10_00520, partial [Nanoarchaeota archaeon]